MKRSTGSMSRGIMALLIARATMYNLAMFVLNMATLLNTATFLTGGFPPITGIVLRECPIHRNWSAMSPRRKSICGHPPAHRCRTRDRPA
jgi:hypothetical protein